MRFFGHTFVAVAVVASLMLPTRAALMTDAEETAKAAGLDEVTSFFKAYWLKADKLYKDMGSQCKAVSTAYAPFDSGGATPCDSGKQCSSTSPDTACCKKGDAGNEKAKGCNDAPDDWRKANNGEGGADDGAVRWLRAAHLTCSTRTVCAPSANVHLRISRRRRTRD
jgi:hypothetical protein